MKYFKKRPFTTTVVVLHLLSIIFVILSFIFNKNYGLHNLTTILLTIIMPLVPWGPFGNNFDPFSQSVAVGLTWLSVLVAGIFAIQLIWLLIASAFDNTLSLIMAVRSKRKNHSTHAKSLLEELLAEMKKEEFKQLRPFIGLLDYLSRLIN